MFLPSQSPKESSCFLISEPWCRTNGLHTVNDCSSQRAVTLRNSRWKQELELAARLCEDESCNAERLQGSGRAPRRDCCIQETGTEFKCAAENPPWGRSIFLWNIQGVKKKPQKYFPTHLNEACFLIFDWLLICHPSSCSANFRHHTKPGSILRRSLGDAQKLPVHYQHQQTCYVTAEFCFGRDVRERISALAELLNFKVSVTLWQPVTSSPLPACSHVWKLTWI